MKSYTDLEQSKKLAKILPTESADMNWHFWKSEIDAPKLPTFGYSKDAAENYKSTEAVYLPCWSLAALLDVLPYPEIWQDHSTNRWACSSLIKDTEYLWESENPVDSCVEVIIKLHKEGLL